MAVNIAGTSADPVPADVALVGAGLIGCAWALVFARAGARVKVHDASSEVRASLPDRLALDLEVLVRHGLVADASSVLARIDVAERVGDAVADAVLVQESGPEDVALKQRLFAELDEAARPQAILASSTSAIVASRFTESLAGRARCLVAHPVNPPHLIPLVELCGAPWTSAEVLDRAERWYRAVGQVPVRIRSEIEGFVLNRLQGAVLAEAFRLVGDGVISPQDLDRTMSEGLGHRWSFLGPFATIELNAPGGMPDYCDRYTGFYERLASDPPGAAAFGAGTIAAILAAWPGEADPERLAGLSSHRDDRLAALAAHKRAQED